MKANPFVYLQSEYSSYYKINKQLQDSSLYIPPCEIKLPPDSSGKISTFQYTPVDKTLEAVTSDPDFGKLSQEPTPEGVLYDIKDGTAWRENKYFQENPDALTGMLYSDALELDNPLGAAKGKHKIVNVYLSLVDIPKFLRSKKENIFLVLTVKDKDLKENYFHVLKPLLEDLKKLESGVKVGEKTIKLGILCYCADNLEASIVGGFSQCFSSVDVCRVCHQQYKDLPTISGIPSADAWTREEYDSAAANLQPGAAGEFGMNSACVFNELEAFHCVGQMPLDVMHDYMERVASFDAMSILRGLVSSGLFSFDMYNSLLGEIKLGDYEAADRPMVVNPKGKKIPGKAMAVSQQVRLMPFIIWRILGGIVEESDLINLLVLLVKMQEYLMADRLNVVDSDNFQDLVIEFFAQRKVCVERYPEIFINLTPKYHYLGNVFLFVFSNRFSALVTSAFILRIKV
jgi:hypothetical protein